MNSGVLFFLILVTLWNFLFAGWSFVCVWSGGELLFGLFEVYTQFSLERDKYELPIEFNRMYWYERVIMFFLLYEVVFLLLILLIF
jgi:hypothetical protein